MSRNWRHLFVLLLLALAASFPQTSEAMRPGARPERVTTTCMSAEAIGTTASGEPAVEGYAYDRGLAFCDGAGVGRHGEGRRRDPNGYQDSVNQYAYGANDPINHRDPTGRFLDVLAVGLLFGPKAAAGYAARVGQHLLSALADTTSTMCGPACALLDAALGQPLRPETALEQDSQAGFLEKLNPLNQALRSGLTAGESSGFEQGEQIADAAKGLVDAGLTAAGGAKLTTGVAAKISPKLKSLRNNVALSWKLRFPGELGPQGGTETLYHQGSLVNGRVAAGRPLSTSPDSDLSHYSPEGQLHRFDVPRALLEKWKAEGSLSRGTDYHQPTGLVRPEVRFGGSVSAELNKYRVPPTE